MRAFTRLVLASSIALLASPAFAQTAWYYEMGGAEPIDQPAWTSYNAVPLTASADISWSYSCGKFSLSGSVNKLLSDVRTAADDYLNAMIANAQAAVASLPAIILQRANPTLYDIMQNGLLRSQAMANAARLDCKAMEETIMANGSGAGGVWDNFRQAARISDWKAEASYSRPVDSEDLKWRAAALGRIAAEMGCDLLTGGGFGAMEIVAHAFCETPGRSGRSIGVIPGTGSGFDGAALGKVTSYSLTPKATYPNPWIEVPILTHLPGSDSKGINSRNIVNMASGDVIVILPGGKGTQAEFEIAAGLGKPVIAFVAPGDQVGAYRLEALEPYAVIVHNEDALRDALRKLLLPLALPRPSYAALRGAYQTDPAKVHTCSMHFPNTCAIRLSEALAQVLPEIKAKFKTGGVNLCPHDYVRGAEDLAGVLRKADVFGQYDLGFSKPGSAPASVSGKKGLVAYINIPDFSGQGHIDLWDGSAPAGSAYWNADPIWFWTLPS